MQFSIISIVAALAATATAVYAPVNGTSAAYYPTGTGSLPTSGTAAPTKKPTATLPFTGAASMPTHMAGSALGLVVAGGVALLL
ncbi:hypothetical protein EJ02DRAFT_433770 [Clathrospora elynae]|uniref:Uncharacterized protein n=1 Tax=Clathrospora elynae TaxID=706981 RepID=A0A6A5SSM2_9PLEO|nr:hypothetical protein EJ02DRAFT_433770 [Clathrospora elynae]